MLLQGIAVNAFLFTNFMHVQDKDVWWAETNTVIPLTLQEFSIM